MQRRSGLEAAVAGVRGFLTWGLPQIHRRNIGKNGPIIGLSENMQEAMVFTIFDMINMGLSGFNFFGLSTIGIEISPPHGLNNQ